MTLTLTGDTIAITLPAHSLEYDRVLGLSHERPLENNWVRLGIFDIEDEQDYTAVAQVFDVGSEFGINGGRVSRLSIRNRKDVEIFQYDRGFDHGTATGITIAAFIVNHYDKD